MKLTKEQQQEIKDLQSQESKTKRVTAPQLENMWRVEFSYFLNLKIKSFTKYSSLLKIL